MINAPIFLIEPTTGRALLVSREDSRYWLRFEAELQRQGVRVTRLSGPVAEMLYVALAGHRWSQPPNCWPNWARMARAYLCDRAAFHWQARLAHRAVIEWGEHLQPYLGMTVATIINGQSVDTTTECRTILIDLYTDQIIPHLSTFSITQPFRVRRLTNQQIKANLKEIKL